MTWYILTATAFIITITLHSALCRCYVNINRIIKFIGIFIPICFCLAFAISEKYGLVSLPTFTGILAYLFLCELYVFLFTMILTSISANILFQLSNKRMNISDIMKMYDSSDMVINRISRLIDAGLLYQQDNNLILTTKAKNIQIVFRVAKKIFKHS